MQSDLPSRTLTGSLASRGTAPPLLGRKAEWRQLLDAWRKMAKGQSRIVILSKESMFVEKKWVGASPCVRPRASESVHRHAGARKVTPLLYGWRPHMK
jgi:hypothetical protein